MKRHLDQSYSVDFCLWFFLIGCAPVAVKLGRFAI